jgi:predicted N-acetyltransferase YhbS
MEPAWTPRPATAGDVDALTRLAMRAKASLGYPPEWIAAWRTELTFTPAYVAAHRVAVVEASGQPIGVCALEEHGQWWELAHLWVDPDWQRRGVGGALVRTQLAEAATIRTGPVRVSADPQAEAFYRRLGAHHAGVRTAPMPGAPDRVLPQFTFLPDHGE